MPELLKPIKNPKQKRIKMISQGSYGCIYYPGPQCVNKLDDDDYITKIQKYNETLEREQAISNKIKTLKSYSNYFAPIIESCEVTLSTIDEEEINKCEFLSTKDPSKKNLKDVKYMSNKIKYVGKYTLADHLKNQITLTSNIKRFMHTFINTNVTILEGINMLASIDVVHFDLKENNILCNDKMGRPIIIDFGLSIDVTKISKPRDAFFVYGPDYDAWCIDIAFLTYMSNELESDPTVWKKRVVTIIEMTKIIDEFMKQNMAITTLLTVDEQTKMRTQLIAYFKQFDRSTWQTVYDNLMKYSKTWDNYGIAIIFLQLLSDLHLNIYVEKYSYFKDYSELLKQQVLVTPDLRLTAQDTLTKINKIFSSISRTDDKKLTKELITDLPKYSKIRVKHITNTKMLALQQEKQIYPANVIV